jgi:hypothetical protein
MCVFGFRLRVSPPSLPEWLHRANRGASASVSRATAATLQASDAQGWVLRATILLLVLLAVVAIVVPKSEGSADDDTAVVAPATDPPPSAPPPMLSTSTFQTLLVPPADTDPAIDTWTSPHIAVAGDCYPQRGRLVLYLPGARNTVDAVRPFLENMALRCAHAIGLNYPVDTDSTEDCTTAPTFPDCFAAWRLEKTDGIDRSPHLSVTPANGIENRLEKLLRYLHAQRPNDGWDLYFDAWGLRWDRMALIGVSDGGSQVAMLAKLHLVARVALLSAPVDAVDSLEGKAPAWEHEPGVTPSDRYYAMTHLRDYYLAVEVDGWDALGVPRFPLVNVDSDNLEGAHRLVTSIPCATVYPECTHSILVDPVLAEPLSQAWAYLLGLQ